ncbi:POLO box duplicated region [Cyanobium sp. BA20m-14]|nr:POLO box duplicated region [Cyanobium sp. BA20m-14]
MAPILALLLAVSSNALADRASIWPEWRLPAPLARPLNLPGQRDLTYPAWMEGRWQLHSDNFDVVVQFAADANGAVVGDRAGNAAAIGRALLGEALLEVADDPANPNRQIALLRGNQRLESTVVGRRSETPDGDHFWADELALQVLHGPGDPRVSRVETLSHYSRHSDGSVSAEQWQASYPSPALGLAAAASSSNHFSLELTLVNPDAPANRCAQADPGARVSPCRPPPQSDPAS